MKKLWDKNAYRHKLMEGFASRLKLAMDMRQYTQSALAREVGLTQPEVSYYCSGKSFPRLGVIQKLAFFFKSEL